MVEQVLVEPLGTTEVRSREAITGVISWLNRGIRRGTRISAVVLFGWIKNNKQFEPIVFRQNGIPYLYGSIAEDTAPLINKSQYTTVSTYAIPVNREITLDALVALLPRVDTGGNTLFYVDLGKGRRVVGIRYESVVQWFRGTVYAMAGFSKVMKVKPDGGGGGGGGGSARITAFDVYKG